MFPNPKIFNLFSQNLKYIACIIIGVTILLSFLLNKSNIEQTIIDKREKRKISRGKQEMEKISANFKNFSRELETDNTL